MNQQKDMSKRQMRRQQIRRKETRGRLLWTGLVTIVALLFAFLIIWPMVKPITGISALVPSPRPQAQANNMGDPNAPVKITEYSDYQCPFCKRFFTETEDLLIDNYIAVGKVYFTYRSAGNWVSGNIGGGTESEDAAKAAYCGGDQNKYWEMHDMIFSNVLGENANSFTDRRLGVIAEAAGLDMAQFNDCYSSDKYKGQVDQDLKDALDAGITGTPYFILTYTKASGEEAPAQPIEGAQPFDVFKQAIDAALADSGQ